MKTPNNKDLQALQKAHVADPVIAGTHAGASTAALAVSAADNKGRTKLTVRLDSELHGRIRAAFLADLQAGSGLTSISNWAAHHLEQAVLDTERRLNGSERFSPIETGVVPNFPIA